MFTESEFVLIKTLDRHHARDIGDAQAIIDRKNADLVRLQGVIAELTAQLTAERGQRKLAEFRLRRH